MKYKEYYGAGIRNVEIATLYSSLVLVMLFGGLFQRQVDDYFLTLPLRSACALFAFVAAIVFGRRWFDEQPVWRHSIRPGTKAQVALANHASKATCLTAMRSLLWQEWRQSRLAILSLVGGYFALVIWFGVIFNSSAGEYWEVILVLLPFLSTVLGARTFWADQQGRHFHFFTEHGVRPRWVWLSRQLVSGWTLLFIAVVACVPLLFTWPREQELPGVALGLAVLMFASGQACSIFIRSGIVAVFSAVLCSVMLLGWMFLHELGVWWVVSSLPLPFIFWWATWLYAPQWIQDRTAWRVRVATAASIVIPLLGVIAATAAYRVYEIPAVELSFDPTIPPSDDSPAARETAAMYERADLLLRQRWAVGEAEPTAIAFRDGEWRKGIDLFLAASQRKTARFHHWDDGPGIAFDGKQLTRAVLAEAKARAEEGDLEGAAELHAGLLRLASHFYQQHSEEAHRANGMAVESGLYSILPAWADHESATPVRILGTLTQIQTWSQSNGADWESSFLENRHLVKQLIALDDRVLKNHGMEAKRRFGIKTLGILLSSERWRLSRLLDVYTAAELQGIREILARGPRIPPQAQRTLPWDVRLTSSGAQPKLIRSTNVEAWLWTTRWPGMSPHLTAPDVASWIQQYEVQRSAVQQQLALIAWRKQHGKLPDSLSELLGEPFEILPLDPYTKEQFVYFPNGVEEEIWDDDGMGMGGMGVMSPMSAEGMGLMKPRLVRSEPFLWSPRALLRYAPGTSRGPSESPIASDFRDQQGNTLSEQSLLNQGVRYPIPQADQQPADSADNAAALPKAE